MDNRSGQDIFDDYLKLMTERNETIDQERQSILTKEINKIKKKIKDYVDLQIQSGNIDNDFISFVAKANAFDVLSNDIDFIEESQCLENSNNEYNLSSKFIKSEITGEEISLIGLSNFQKIELIYMHTGCEILQNDSILLRNRECSFSNFMSSLNKYTTVSHLKELYGNNWKEEVEKIYKQAYDRVTSELINHIVEKVDNIRCEKANKLENEIFIKEQKKNELQEQIINLKEEVVGLSNIASQIKAFKQIQLQKDELEQYKRLMTSMLENNSDDKNRFYSDGTLRPDMDEDEYGRYTTSRKNRSRETGMQQRVNDAAHVHFSLDTRDKERLQRKYDQVFGTMPIQDEGIVEVEKPKSM